MSISEITLLDPLGIEATRAKAQVLPWGDSSSAFLLEALTNYAALETKIPSEISPASFGKNFEGFAFVGIGQLNIVESEFDEERFRCGAVFERPVDFLEGFLVGFGILV